MQEIMQFVGRHPILSIAWIALLVAVLVTTFKSLTSKVKVITRGEATRLINKEDAVVVDLRQRDDFRKGHIAGSINLLPSEIKANNVGELCCHRDSRRYNHSYGRSLYVECGSYSSLSVVRQRCSHRQSTGAEGC